jgi:hypothetical protein
MEIKTWDEKTGNFVSKGMCIKFNKKEALSLIAFWANELIEN